MSEELDVAPSTGPSQPTGWLGDRGRLVLASFLMLFVELALIRWTSANNLYLVHLTNFVLLASFLGIGLGFLRAGRRRSLFPWAPVFLTLLVGFVLAFPIQTGIRNDYWALVGLNDTAPLPRWISLSVIFLLTVATLASIAEEVARTFARFEPLTAYRLDVLGSIAGIVLFAGVSFLRLPPLAWALVGAAAFVVLLGRRARWIPAAGVAAVVVLLGIQTVAGGFLWSPYYKVKAVGQDDGSVSIQVNNTPHQTAYPLERLRREHPFYWFPYANSAARDDVLIIGAGSGNDVAVALNQGAQRVDAVEIDPILQKIGKERHPERPYSDPRVTAHIDDGRAFLERTDRRDDLILLLRAWTAAARAPSSRP